VPGRIYVAPPDTHLYVRQGSMEIVRGAKENGHRPSVDAAISSPQRMQVHEKTAWMLRSLLE
jgi:two-component system chemotaxis response regulator CheB